MSESNDILFIKDVRFIVNKKIIMAALIITALSLIFAECLAYLFSDSIYTIFWSFVFAITLGVLINYFVLTSFKIIKKIDVELDEKHEEEIQTVMKIE